MTTPFPVAQIPAVRHPLVVTLMQNALHGYVFIKNARVELDVALTAEMTPFESLRASAIETRAQAARLLLNADLMEEAANTLQSRQEAVLQPLQVEALERLLGDKTPPSEEEIEQDHRIAMMGRPYNTPGHVCWETRRLAMTIADAFARDDSPDRTFWLYTEDGGEPWRLIDGLDATTKKGADGRPLHYTLDFASGASREGIEGDAIVYMQQSLAERNLYVSH